METQLAKLGLSDHYRRFAASDGNVLGLRDSRLRDGQIGCFVSHFLSLQQNAASDDHLHVIEDDVLLSAQTKPILEKVISGGALDKFDIIFTDTLITAHNVPEIREYEALYQSRVSRRIGGPPVVDDFAVIDLHNRNFACVASFLVNRASIPKLCDMLEAEIKRGPRLPVDLFIRSKTREGAIKAGCVFPFITSVKLSLETNIPGRYESDVSILAGLVLRHAFFVECDVKECNRVVSQFLSVKDQDTHQQLLSKIVEFALLGDYKPY